MREADKPVVIATIILGIITLVSSITLLVVRVI
jgi:hypothetical protein